MAKTPVKKSATEDPIEASMTSTTPVAVALLSDSGGGGSSGGVSSPDGEVVGTFKLAEHDVTLATAPVDPSGILGVMISIFNRLTGDQFERCLSADEITKGSLFDASSSPPVLKTVDGFKAFVKDALLEVCKENVKAVATEGIECHGSEVDSTFSLTITVTVGSGWLSQHYKATIVAQLSKAATPETKYALALHAVREEFMQEADAFRSELRAEFEERFQALQVENNTLHQEVDRLVEVVKALVTLPQFAQETTSSFNVDDDTDVPLFNHAVKSGMRGAVEFLVSECGMEAQESVKTVVSASVFQENNKGNGVLSIARSSYEIKKLSSMHIAIKNKDESMVKYLLNNGGKSLIEKRAGYMPQQEQSKYLSGNRQTGEADTYLLNNKGKKTPGGCNDADPKTNYSQTLLAGPNFDKSPETPLQSAAQTGCLAVVKLLVEQGGAITHRDELKVPNGSEGDLTAGYLQSHGSKPVVRF